MSASTYCLLRLNWRVLKPITHVPHFQGTLWSALFRHAYNAVLKPDEAYHQVGLMLHPAEFGVPAYEQDDRISLGLAVPESELTRLASVLFQLEHAPGTHGQFQPGNTLRWEHAQCRISGAPWPEFPASPLQEAVLIDAAHRLAMLPSFRLVFHAPLRLTKPPHTKFNGRYCDSYFFRTHPLALDHLLSQIPDYSGESSLDLVTEDVHGRWLDVSYGRTTKPTPMGGFGGVLPIKGCIRAPDALALLRQSFLGIGKNRAFGLGCFSIPEVTSLLHILPLPKHRRLRRGFCSMGNSQQRLRAL